jgi:hypothetical protein
MPNCFQLTKIGEEVATTLQEVDNELWLKFVGSIPKPNDHWYCGWYDSVGFDLACGNSFDVIKASYSVNSRIVPVIEYLKKYYTARSWYEHK